MKTKLFLIALLCLSASLSFGQQNLPIDTKTSIVNWIGHAEVGTYAPAGTLVFKQGTVQLKGENITGANLIIDMKSMHQDNENLLHHLKSEDFFDVEKYPLSTIVISRVENGKAYGQLTIKNKTLPVNITIDKQKTAGKLIISGSTVIDRTGYGITYNSGSFFSGLGDKAIRNTFDISFKVVVTE